MKKRFIFITARRKELRGGNMKKRRLMLCSLVSLIMVFVMAVPMTVSAAETTVSTGTLQAAINSAQSGDVIKLGQNFNESITIPKDKNITLDLNGQTLTGESGKTAIKVAGGLVVKDSTATAAPSVSSDYKTVSYTSGKITATTTTVGVISGGTFELQSGMVESTGNIGIIAVGEKDATKTPVNSTATISGGYVLAQEFAASAQGNGAKLNINGGVLVAKDNAVVAGNGTKNLGGTTINITNGIMIGHIQSAGYIACGVYHPQSGNLRISGGTIYADGGVGILMRSGDLSMTGGKVIATGTAQGKVGDSSVIANCYGIQVDTKSNYPGVSGITASVSENAEVVAAAGVDAINALGDDAAHHIVVASGCYSSDVSGFTPSGKVVIKFRSGQDQKYYVGDQKEIQEIANTAKDGDTIDVIKGSITLNMTTPGVNVNNGPNNEGTVTVNGTTLEPNTGMKIQNPATDPTKPSQDQTQKPSDTAKADKSAKTGDDFNLFAVGGVALAAIIAMAAVAITGRRHRQR